MGREERFDSFYLATRRALVHQTFALTGDLGAAQSAVRDAYVAAWHHWRKASAYDDPQDWVRPRAWQLAQRRHTARLWHRTKGLSAEDKAVLDAIAKLPMAQRRTLLLIQLAGVPLAEAARELHASQEVTEQNLQSASANLAVSLDTDSSTIRARLLALADAASAAQLPRASIVRRAGKKRRRSHTLVAAVAASLVAVASGAFAHQPSAVQAEGSHLVQTPAEPPTEQPPEPQPTLPTADSLLDQRQIARLGPQQRWRVEATHDNTAGEGINNVCQESRFADPDGLSALVREFTARGNPKRSAVQTIEISKSAAEASAAFDTMVGWYAGCQVSRLQLLQAYDVDGVGDQATMLTARVWSRPVTTYSVALAQVGQVVISTVGENVGVETVPTTKVVQALADAVDLVCAQAGETGCAERPRVRAVPPPPSGEERGILAVADLPPVGNIDEPWVGTNGTPGRRNPSATACDRANFSRDGATRTRTRTFLIPGERLPDRFGLSETYGVFVTAKAASRFLAQVRARVAACEERELATQVLRARTVGSRGNGVDGSTWLLETEISDNEAVEFRVGFIRVGKAVAQLTFAPAGRADIDDGDFRLLVIRAGSRLGELE